MKKYISIIILVAIISACSDQSTDLNKDISIPVSVLEIKPSSIEKYIGTTASVKPVKEVKLKAEITGNYKLLKNPASGKVFKLGDLVKKGEQIIMFESREYENGIKNTAHKLRMEISKQVYKKQQSLYEKGGVTLSELKDAEINYINAKYSFEDAIIRLEKMVVIAPFTGTIVDLPYKTEGTKIEVGTEIVQIMNYRKMYMNINIPEKNMKDIRINQLVRIMNYTIPDDTLKGRIMQISPAIDESSRSFKAVVSIENTKLKLRPGMFAKGEIIVSALDSVIVIPKNIILSKQRGNTVYIVNKGLSEERIISFGLENPEYVQVISGLSFNDRLVNKGFETLRNKSKVKVVK